MSDPIVEAPDGAFVIGGGYGQDVTEQSVRGLFMVPSIGSGSPFALLQSQLSKLPIDALKPFKPMIPGATDNDFLDVPSAVSKIMSNLVDGAGKVLDLLNRAVNQVIDIFRGLVITPINEAVQGVKDWFTGLLTWRQDVVTRLDIVETALEQIEAATPVTQAYVADINDMATCARQALKGYDADGRIYLPTYKPDRYFSVTGNLVSYVDYTPIVVDRAGVVKKLRWIGGEVVNFLDIDGYYMALCVYDPADGFIKTIWQSGNLKDTTMNINSLREVEVDMGINQRCTPGQILFVAHQQIAPGSAQVTRSFACEEQTGIARPSTLLLDACTYRSPHREPAIPGSILKSSLEKINTRIPWAAVSVDTTVPA
ncbi:minor tail protein [Gordonia phage Anon]|nr:minor tail protein [Gordonia phage Anon]